MQTVEKQMVLSMIDVVTAELRDESIRQGMHQEEHLQLYNIIADIYREQIESMQTYDNELEDLDWMLITNYTPKVKGRYLITIVINGEKKVVEGIYTGEKWLYMTDDGKIQYFGKNDNLLYAWKPLTTPCE